MDKAASITTTVVCRATPDHGVITAAALATASYADFHAALAGTPDTPNADHAGVSIALEAHREACVALAAMPAATLAGWQAKARALSGMTLTARGRPDALDDDTGLAASLLADLARAA